jgi:hypothetical protein
VNEESIYANKNYFAADVEKAVESVRKDFREKHNIA